MIPAPNVVAGLLIGLFNPTWGTTLLAASLWPLVFCVYQSFVDGERREVFVASLRSRPSAAGHAHPVRAYYFVEAWTALLTAGPIAAVAHGARFLFT